MLTGCNGAEVTEPAQTLTQTPSHTPTIDYTYYDMTTKTPGPGQTAYTDPEGWFTFNYPAAWKPGDQANLLTGEDGFVESGYLPEMGYMEWAGDICTWLANQEPQQKVTISYFSKDGSRCLLNYPSWDLPEYRMEIIENSEADPDQRFIYIKVDGKHYDLMSQSFTWIKPVRWILKFDHSKMPLRPADSLFWEESLAASFTVDISIEEYPVFEGNQSAILQGDYKSLPNMESDKYWKLKTPEPGWVKDQLETINNQIGLFDYRLEGGEFYTLYQDDDLLLQNIFQLPDIQLIKTPEGNQLAFLAYTLAEKNLPDYASYNVRIFLVHNDEITFWDNPEDIYHDPGLPPIYCNGEILLLMDLVDPSDAMAEALVVIDSQQMEKYRFIGPIENAENFQCWQDHWVIDLRGFLIQDGQILNQVYDYEEIFGWHLVNDQPFFFFRKGPRFGIRYDDQVLPVYYEDIYFPYDYQGYLTYSMPQFDDRSARFFAKRDGVWYSVVIR